MKLLSLKNNPLFIKNWYERMRLIPVIATFVIVAIIIFFIFLGFYLNREYMDTAGSGGTVHWLRDVFFAVVFLQTFIIVIAGAWSVNKMGIQERLSGTLDFHRCSPVSRFDQIVGMLIGGAILEWCIFLGILPFNLAIAIVVPIDFLSVITFYLLIMLTAIFFHSLSLLEAVGLGHKKGRSNIGAFILLFLIISGFLGNVNVPVLSITFGVPAFKLLMAATESVQTVFNPPMGFFFTIEIPEIVLQIIFQGLFLIVITGGIKRKISYPDRMLFSKRQSIVLCSIFFIFYSGCMFSSVIDGIKMPYHLVSITFFFYILFLGAILGLLNVTPDNLMYKKGLRRMQKAGRGKFTLDDDYNSNWMWLILFLLIIFIIHSVFLFQTDLRFADTLWCLFILMVQIGFFAGAFEFFRLSAYNKNYIVFWTAIAIPWLAIPVFGFISSPLIKDLNYLQFFIAPSPVILFSFLPANLSGNPISDNRLSYPLLFVINALLSVITLYLAAYQRRLLQKTELFPQK